MPTFPATASEQLVVDAVLSTVQTWYHTYLAWSERLHGWDPDTARRPMSYQARSSFAGVEDRQMPMIAVSCPEVADMERTHDGRWDGWVPVIVGVVVVAPTHETATRLARVHTVALRQLLTGKPLLDGSVEIDGFGLDQGADYADSSFDAATAKNTRASGVVGAAYHVQALAWDAAGPETPTPGPAVNPPADPATADTVDVQVTPNGA